MEQNPQHLVPKHIPITQMTRYRGKHTSWYSSQGSAPLKVTQTCWLKVNVLKIARVRDRQWTCSLRNFLILDCSTMYTREFE